MGVELEVEDPSQPHRALIPRSQSGVGKRLVLFTIGLALGGLLFLVGGISSHPAPPKCPGCAILSSSVPTSGCAEAEAVQGGWICEGSTP